MYRMYFYFSRLLCVIKATIAWIIIKTFCRKLTFENIWLFEEKHTEARDNAYHLFMFIKKYHPEINSFYTIKKNTADELKVKEFGTIIHAETIKHYMYWIAAKYSISSQPYGAAPNPREWVKKLGFFCRKDQKVIFLQHGIIINDLPGLDYSRTGFDLFSCSALPEQRYIREGLHYPEKNAKLLGLCRFDNLKNFNKQNIILIMPTFRKWLVSSNPDSEAKENEIKHFIQSDYYLRYRDLLTNKAMLDMARENGYRIIFYLHYGIQSYSKAFSSCANQTVTIADRNHYDVQQLLMDCALLITDYSSVFFDFAYMEKPEIFYQFDEEQYRSGHYNSGYFDYCKDGFGPVFKKEEDLISYLTFLLRNKCEIESEYRRRIHSFFLFRDEHNCERTYNAIREI